ncbi:MAG: hypothetical protein HY368_02165 [Candidatus Aenigmarchaeota archaeon]|nr:hypothetical protein [Candidatus Aenigmarchaeota archaeon]
MSWDPRNTRIYERELGRPFREFEYVDSVPQGVVIDGRFIPVEEVEPWYLTDGLHHIILGMTNGAKIWLRKGMDYFNKRKTLLHEMLHLTDMSASEEQIRERTDAVMRGASLLRPSYYLVYN